MRRLLLAWTAAYTLFAGALFCAADEPFGGRYSKTVEIGRLKQDEIVSILLDDDIYAATRDRFPDLRILDDEGQGVPYLLEKVLETRTESTRRWWLARVASLKPAEGGGVETFVQVNNQEPVPDAIRLITSLRNYEQRVQVFGSSDGRRWEELARDALVFDYAPYLDLANNEIPLPENTFRRFRIVIDNVTAEQESELFDLTRRLRENGHAEPIEKIKVDRRPFHIDRIEFRHTVVSEQVKGDKMTGYAVAGFRVKDVEDKKQTVIEVRSLRQPLTSFTLKTSSRNFSRPACVQIPSFGGITNAYHEIGRETISRIHFRKLHREQLRIGFPETRSDEFRVVIENQDNPPLAITGIISEGSVYQAIFLASPDASYCVQYGSESATSPRYDTAAIRASLRQGYEPVLTRLGAQIESPYAANGSAWSVGNLLRNRLLIVGIIAMLVAVLAWGLYRAAGRVDALPKE